MHSIVLIIPYFGRFNEFNSFWLKSAEKNPSVDFLIFTDQNIGCGIDNVHVVKMTFGECRARFQSLLDCDVSALHPYKLCDFKPAYGYLFQDYIRDYDFWGHCDNDIILGDIRHFLTEDILDANDRILTRGHFTLYRNTGTVNEIFRQASPSYREVFPSELIFHFDEHPGTGRYWFGNLSSRLYDEIIFDDLDWHRYLFVDVHKGRTLDRDRKYFIYIFENGRLFRCFWDTDHVGREEIMYVHFQKRNMKVRTQVADYFAVIPNAFVPYVHNVDRAWLEKNVRDNILYVPVHFIRVKMKSLQRKIGLWRRRVRK